MLSFRINERVKNIYVWSFCFFFLSFAFRSLKIIGWFVCDEISLRVSYSIDIFRCWCMWTKSHRHTRTHLVRCFHQNENEVWEKNTVHLMPVIWRRCRHSNFHLCSHATTKLTTINITCVRVCHTMTCRGNGETMVSWVRELSFSSILCSAFNAQKGVWLTSM